jgi:Flp pilus assembly protein TadD
MNAEQSRELKMTDEKADISAAIDRAVEATASKSGPAGSLMMLEREYKRNSTDPNIAYNYAKALRASGDLKLASVVLSPFARDEDSIAEVKAEMAAIQLALGNYRSAEEYATKAVVQNSGDYESFQTLGIALDGQEKHPEAEKAFRKSLELWQGDPIPIMNNLALNLATQDYLDEAIEILERAKALAPDRIEIERNLRIVRTLKDR